MGNVKNSKRWCAAPCGREVPIEEKFCKKEDKNKRVYLPKIRMRNSDVAYLKEAARRHGVSASCELERILSRVFSTGMLTFCVRKYRSRDRKRKRAYLTEEESRVRPKYTVHPSYVDLLRGEAKKRGMEITLLMCEVFSVYRRRFPIYLGSSLK